MQVWWFMVDMIVIFVEKSFELRLPCCRTVGISRLMLGRQQAKLWVVCACGGRGELTRIWYIALLVVYAQLKFQAWVSLHIHTFCFLFCFCFCFWWFGTYIITRQLCMSSNDVEAGTIPLSKKIGCHSYLWHPWICYNFDTYSAYFKGSIHTVH